MHHHHHRDHRFGERGPRMFFRGPFPNRLELLDRLEAFRRDLEQQLADVSDVIEHLHDRGEPQPQQ